MPIRRKRMGIDVDEVLADFQGAVLDIARETLGVHMTPADLPSWDLFNAFPEDQREILRKESKRPGFCASLKVNPGTQEAVRELRNYADLYAVTSHYDSHTWVSERDWWLKTHFGIERSHVIHTSAKFMVGVDMFLDDKPSNVLDWHKEHPQRLAMMWPIPNTSNYAMDGYRVKDWDHVIELVRDHKVR